MGRTGEGSEPPPKVGARLGSRATASELRPERWLCFAAQTSALFSGCAFICCEFTWLMTAGVFVTPPLLAQVSQMCRKRTETQPVPWLWLPTAELPVGHGQGEPCPCATPWDTARGSAGRTGRPRAPQGSAKRWGPSCLPGTKAHAGSAAFPTAAPAVRGIFNLVPNAVPPLPPWLGAAAAPRCVLTACGGPGTPPGSTLAGRGWQRGPSLPG